MKPNHHLLAAAISLCFVLWGASPHTEAGPIDAANIYAKFIEQRRTDPLPNEDAKCVATSMINSFVFLKNMYPSVYGGTKITRGSGDSLEQARDELSGFVRCGASAQSHWEASFAGSTPMAVERQYSMGWSTKTSPAGQAGGS